MIQLLAILVVSAALASLRIGGERGELFQAVAHFWVCWLFCVAYFRKSRSFLEFGIALSLVELACALGLVPLVAWAQAAVPVLGVAYFLLFLWRAGQL